MNPFLKKLANNKKRGHHSCKDLFVINSLKNTLVILTFNNLDIGF
jgi:hypothetical protein